MFVEHLSSSLQMPLTVNRLHGTFKGLSGIFRLWKYVFKHTDADVVVSVQRMAIPAILKSLFMRNKVIVVFHHYDKREALSLFYHLNAWLLFSVLAVAPAHVRVVVVADFWREFLIRKGVSSPIITVVPNLFDPGKYQADKSIPKNSKQIYFGQYSAKQHESVFELIDQLSMEGYDCFFTTPSTHTISTKNKVKVLNLSFDEYLQQLSSSAYTVCLGAFNEGWNRVAHESLLCGTPVIGNASGGLGDLIQQSGQFLVKDSAEAYHIITTNQKREINPAFLSQYDISQISYYAQPIIAFCKG